MTSLLLVLVVVLTAVPGTLAVGRAFARKDRRQAKLAIRWAGVTALVALLIMAVNYARLMGAVADADPSQKTWVLEQGTVPVLLAFRLGAALACLLGLLGGVARGLASEDEPRHPGG